MSQSDSLKSGLPSLSNLLSGAAVVVAYSHGYAPAMQMLNYVKAYIAKFPSIRLVPLNADDDRALLSDSILRITEIPTVLLFLHGRPFSTPSSDIYLVSNRLKRLAIRSTELDTFESMGTRLNVPVGMSLGEWEPTSQDFRNVGNAPHALFTIMDSLFDI